MALNTAKFANLIMSVKEETTEGDFAADAAANVVVPRINVDPAYRFGREVSDPAYMTGGLSKSAPTVGGITDAGLTVPLWMRGKGSNSQPECTPLMKASMGGHNAGTDGTVQASPSPKTHYFTVDGSADFVEGQVIAHQSSGGTWETSIVEDFTAAVVTCYPPFTDIAATDTVYAGDAFTLKSDDTDFTTLAVRAYNDQSLTHGFDGCRGNMSINFAVNQLVPMDFVLNAIDYHVDQAAIGYTAVPDVTTQPKTCNGMTLEMVYTCEVITGSTTTSVKLSGTNSNVEPPIEVGDYIDVNTGTEASEAAKTWERKEVTAVSGAGTGTITCTVSALSGAPTAGYTAYHYKYDCGGSIADTFSINVEIGRDMLMCMAADDGIAAQRIVERDVSVQMSAYWQRYHDLLQRDYSVGTRMTLVLGDFADLADNNICVVSMPNIHLMEFTLTSDPTIKQNVSGGAYKFNDRQNSELAITMF